MPGSGDPDGPAAIARDYVATGNTDVLNRIFRISRFDRGPAVAVLMPLLVPTAPVPTLERAFAMFRCLDARGPASITALRPFLAVDQPMRGHALCAIDALGHDGEALIPDLLVLLSHGDSFASSALSRIGRRGDVVVPALLAVLKDSRGVPRRDVIDALGNPAWALYADRIVPALTGIVAAPEPPRPDDEVSFGGSVSLRGRAAYALSNLGLQAEPALPVLLAALAEQDPGLRLGLLAALRGIGPRASAAVPALLELLRAIPREPGDSGNMQDVYAILDTVKRIGPRTTAGSSILVDLALSQNRNLALKARETLEAVGNLSAADAARLLAGAEALPQHRDGVLVALLGPGGAGPETFLTRWVTADARLREDMEWAQARCTSTTPPAVTPGLQALSNHADLAVRRATLRYLARFQPRPVWIADALDALLTTGESNDVATWLFAMSMDPPRCASRLQDLIARTRDRETAPGACRAIGAAAPLQPAQVAELRALLKDPEPARHLAAAAALAGHLTAEEEHVAMTAALAALDNQAWIFTAAETLQTLRADPGAAAVIRSHFDHGEFPIRLRLLPALDRHLPDAAGVDLLMGLLDDPVPNLVQLACRQLEGHGQEGRRALPRLRAMAWAPEGEHAQDAWRAIVALDPDDHEAVGRVAAQAWWGPSVQRLAAIAALTTHPAVVPVLRQLGERLADEVDPEIATAGRNLAERHRR